MNKNHRFPLFLDLSEKKVVIVGAGKIALRRIKALIPFGCDILVIAPKAEEEILQLLQNKLINYETREFVVEDLYNAFLVVAATNKRSINYEIGIAAKKLNILVSVADKSSECTFFFPAIINIDDTIIGIVGNGTDHKKVKAISDEIRDVLKQKRGKCNEDKSWKP